MPFLLIIIGYAIEIAEQEAVPWNDLVPEAMSNDLWLLKH